MTKPLVILITNIRLANPGGSEVVTRDLALGLLRRGHRPVVYSPDLGEVAQEVSSRGVVVVDDLRNLAEAPDIIHGHHSITCGEALMRFPETPALFVCHAFSIWVEAPIHFPQIGAYGAVDEACRDRLVQAEAIDPSRVVLLPNAVDLRRFPVRTRALPERPLRALAFGKAAAVPELRTACERLGIEFASLGLRINRLDPNPEEQLGGVDLVFATARAALEGLCAGSAVVVCDHRGFGGLVTSANYESLRARNFGLRSLGDPVTVDRLVSAVGAYDAADATRVSARARDDADLEKLLDRCEALYDEIISGFRRPVITPEAHRKAVETFLHDNLPRRISDTRWPWRGERESLQRQIKNLESRLAATVDQSQVIERLRQQLSGATSALRAAQADAAVAQNDRDVSSRVLNSRSALARRLFSVLVSKVAKRPKRLRSSG